MLGCCLALYLRLEIFIWLPLWPMVGTAALVWGRWEERLGFVAFLTTLAVTRQVFGLQAPSPAVIVVDAFFLAVLGFIAVRSERWWPSWAAAFQLAAVATRLLFFAPRPGIEPYEYFVSLAIWTWLVFIAVSLGAWDRWRGRRPGVRRRGQAATTFVLMTAFALWYTWPVLPSRLAEVGISL